ncbi:GGDEF domain-containing protein [Rhodococcus sp. AD45-ID]|jgi:diguanylate cyclase|uniref:Diguanylate cyclase (GGDEF)-like protein n=1 Tax=Nocardia globerula TaxID=1818 RepID=A0A652YPF2_NOCGL|nr:MULTISPECIES: GGDEF domain-containing protein [Rhodococcus]NMD62761.1 GGDEF domain-containing protein [Nocardia globerula]KJF25206.1 putative diguanylate cyclase AdrA [Rhodococcus sp. AD45]MCE4266042.1 GGDEF domain-containing protein [Rhodococcus globerulus]PSR43387.1 GGDEF domain-containing protein [Rhodococcus sp. AD45-ID]PVX68216.1 diguanylate cyclase (GGDEF)-like protein [Rhodococcus globerulus]
MDPLLQSWPVPPSVMLWGSKNGPGSMLRLVNFTIGFCSLNFSLVAYLFLISGEGPDRQFARTWLIAFATVNLIPTALWFLGKVRGSRALKLFGIWADLGTASVIITFTSHDAALFGAVLFVASGAYFTYFLNFRWLAFHLAFSCTFIISLAILAITRGTLPTAGVIARTDVILCAVIFIPATIQLAWRQLLARANGSKVDALTGLLNRRGLWDMAERVWSTSHANRVDVAVAVVDIDKFKAVNDAYGHEVGDTVIIRTGNRLQQHVNGFGYAARTGGEEFTLVMIGTPYGLRKRIATLPRAVVEATDAPLATVSIGASTMPFTPDVEQFDYTAFSRAIVHADHLMYEAKSSGGNSANTAPLDMTRFDRSGN